MCSEGGAQPVRSRDSILPDVQVEVVGEQRVKLQAEQAAFGQQGAVLLDNGEEMRHATTLREDDGLAEQGTAFRAADVECIGQCREVGEHGVVGRAGECVGQPRTVHVEGQLVALADVVDGREFGPRIQRAVLRRLRDVDQTGDDHVLAVAVVQVFLAVDGEVRRIDFAKMVWQRQHLVPAKLDGSRLVYADVPAAGRDDTLVGVQQGVNDSRVRLRAANQEMHLRLRAVAGGADFLPRCR